MRTTTHTVAMGKDSLSSYFSGSRGVVTGVVEAAICTT
jgi:hypothetical protein